MMTQFNIKSQQTKTSNMLSTASDIWTFLKQRGGLSLDNYDQDIPKELFAALHSSFRSSRATDLDSLLKAEAVCVEDFLVAFFRVVQPFGEMMDDLLCFFEDADATQGKQNLAVRFDFNKEIPPLEFDLEHFRKWQECWQMLTGPFLSNVWNCDSLWKLNGILRSMDDRVSDPRMQRWLDVYRAGNNSRGQWPDAEPPPPQSGLPNLDATLARVWRVWLTVVQQSKRHGVERERLNQLCFGPDQMRSSEPESEQNQEPWPVQLLGRLDSDHWAASLAQGAYCRAEGICAISEPERSAEASALNQKLQELFESLQVVEIEGESLKRILQDFLNLPIWQRRHELYSAWISTQIVNALREYGVNLHCVGGRLLFEFRGTHLATIGTFHPNLHLMSELRSPLSAPRGFGRKRAIQPDYSLITSPITSPECSILEVECKQYFVASKRKFADALTDYANGRPNAHIVLVNYGPATDGILDEVDIGVRHRTHVIGSMRPSTEPAQRDFAELVKTIVRDRFTSVARPTATVPLSQTQLGLLAGQIVLRWENTPRDLDLHLRIFHEGQSLEVNFSHKGDISNEPWALLDQDVQAGSGPETIQIARWLVGTYRCAVHNYSRDQTLVGCGAKHTLTLVGHELSFECPTSGTGEWWEVFLFSPATHKLDILNRITSSFA